ncbi:MAG: ABC transporter ATP-binding protein [Desulfobacteraceae bacterium]|nr:ABC transporter ATP-binding protein [Desulfobacteraceae bacterium]MBC2757648.1 ABC transporter ATP-binding protein [Desulfobacteraceae bacterium]MBC2763893.1 ABC transporter ATP-binding protein [ANME-2 cluster archaeon]
MQNNKENEQNESLLFSLNRLRFLFNRRDKVFFFILLIGMIFGACLETFSIGVIPAFISVAINPQKILQYEAAEAVFGFLGITTSRDILLWGCFSLLLIFTIKTGYLCLQYYFQVRYVQNRRFRLTRRLFSAYMSAPYQFHIQRNSAELFRNTILEVNEIMVKVLMPLLNLTMQGMIMVAILVLLFAVQPVMALVATVLLGFAGGGFQWFVKKKLIEYSRQAQEHRQLMINSIQQGLGVIKELRILHREKNFVNTFVRSLWEALKAARYEALTTKITAPYLEFVAVSGLLCITILLIFLGQKVESMAPTLVLFAVSFVKLKASISQVVNGVNQIRFGVVSIKPVYTDLKLLETSKRKNVPKSTGISTQRSWDFSKELRLEGVSYRYPGCKEFALKDIHLNLPKSHCIALVGQTGSGKTTLVDVILGLLEPESGRIIVDGRDIHTDLPAWQTNIGYIPQFIYLTDDSVRHNIALGLDDSEINDDQLWQAIRVTQLKSFVQDLPQGIETIIGEGGIKLSGGQRQRIGIARALYHNPEVLIMDEATSALDNATEKAVVDSIHQLKGEKTIIMIAHRLSTVQNSDTLYFMKNGQIKLSGKYKELIHTHSEFRQMIQTG